MSKLKIFRIVTCVMMIPIVYIAFVVGLFGLAATFNIVSITSSVKAFHLFLSLSMLSCVFSYFIYVYDTIKYK